MTGGSCWGAEVTLIWGCGPWVAHALLGSSTTMYLWGALIGFRRLSVTTTTTIGHEADDSLNVLGPHYLIGSDTLRGYGLVGKSVSL